MKIFRNVAIISLILGICLLVGAFALGSKGISQYFINREKQLSTMKNNYSYEANLINEIDIEISGAKLVYEEYEGTTIQISSNYKIMVEEEGNSLEIKHNQNIFNGLLSWQKNNFKITIKVPKGYQSKETSITVNGGIASVDNIATTKFDIEVNGGVLTVNNLTCQELDVEVNAGSCVLSRVDALHSGLEVNAGKLEAVFLNRQEGYSITTKTNMGSIEQNITNINNTSTYKIEAETNVGKIKLQTTE